MKNFLTIVLIGSVFLIFAVSAPAQRKTDTTDLNVTVDDSVTANGGVRSDGGSAYSHGVSSVTAAFQANGHFVFNSGTRPVNFIYSLGLDGQSSLLANDSPAFAKARTFPTTPTGYVPMQSMAANTSQCVGMTWEYAGPNGFTRNVSYHYGTGDQSVTAFVTVTYDGTNWIMQPSDLNNCSGGSLNHDNAGVVKDSKTAKGKTTTLSHGRYFMPFNLTLTRK